MKKFALQCPRCKRLMKAVGSSGPSDRWMGGFVCVCRNYCIMSKNGKKVDFSWHPDLILAAGMPVHQEIMDELARLERAGSV